MKRVTFKNIHGFLFSILIFSLPINLGLHLGSNSIDYLIPTLWFQDILIALILIFWVFSNNFKDLFSKNFLKDHRVLFLFLISFLPSLVIAPSFIAAFYIFIRIVLYVFFVIYISSTIDLKKDFAKIVRLLSLSVIFLGVFSILQWYSQSSIFNNYLFFGEQPYSWSTPNVARTDFLGYLKIPSYGTFRHPNIFAGFLSIVIFWIHSFLVSQKSVSKKKNILFKLAFTLGFISLILTFSQIGMFALFVAMLLLLFFKGNGISEKAVSVVLWLIFGVFILGLFLPMFSKIDAVGADPSFYRRSNLLKSAYFMIEDFPYIGTGLNNFTVNLIDYLPLTQVLRFNQPVHNIFVLIASESGVFTLMFYFSILFYCLSVLSVALKKGDNRAFVLMVTMLQLFILGSFDHYLYTIHQTQILFWLTIGLSLSYTKRDAKV